MNKQRFYVTIQLDTNTHNQLLTTDVVRRQVERVFRGFRVTEGLPCYGNTKTRVAAVGEGEADPPKRRVPKSESKKED